MLLTAPFAVQADELAQATFAEPTAAGQLLFSPGLLWGAVQHDAARASQAPGAHLARVKRATASFFSNEDVGGLPRVVDHEVALAALGRLGQVEGEGVLQLLTGPRSIGKSLMLRKVAAELKAKTNRHPVIVDARQHGTDLVRGFVASLPANKSFFESMAAATTPAIAEAIGKLAETHVPGLGKIVTTVASGLTDRPVELRLGELLGAFIVACKREGQYPILIIDEANKALAATDPASRQRTLDALDLLTHVTKQEREASVVLAASEHWLPFHLRKLGYNTDHIRKTIVAEEVPPAVMKQLLTETWCCGEQLATTLLMLYGGHVLHASTAVFELAAATDPGAVKGVAALGSLVRAPAMCVDDDTLAAAAVPERERDRLRERVLTALRALVVDGFVALDTDTDKVAEVISLANAGYVVPVDATAAAVPTRAWEASTPSGEAATHVLVPSSHIMRLLIARKAFPLRPPPASMSHSASTA